MSTTLAASGTVDTEPSVVFSATRASLWLDLVRALAALLVLGNHWRNLLFVDYTQIVSHRALLMIPYALAGAGHDCVIVFFVLSGYLVTGSIFRMYEKQKWCWVTYLTHRLTRLWLVLVPALALGYLWDRTGLRLPFAQALYSGNSHNHIVVDVAAHISASTALANVFFLQNARSSTFGSNTALWSLSNEFWYYILFPLAFFACKTFYGIKTRIVFVALFLAAAWLVGSSILLSFPFWLCGALLLVLPRLRVSPALRVVTVIAFLAVFFACVMFGHKAFIPGGQWTIDAIISIATTSLLWVLNGDLAQAKAGWFATSVRTTARFSYTLYLVHLPLLVLITGLLLKDQQRWVPDPRHLLIASAAAILVILFSWLVASLTEFHTAAVVARIQRAFATSGPARRGVNVS